MNFPFRVVDLTHTINNKIPSWDMGCGFNHKIKIDYHNCKQNVKFRVQQIDMYAGIGTHIDSPSHCIPYANTVDSIALNNLIAPLIVIDIPKNTPDDYQLSIDDIQYFERQYCTIPNKSFVAIHTRWGKNWSNPTKYHNNYIFPSISPEAACTLIDRNIVGIGIDTLSPDVPSSGFPVHNIILGSNKYIIENIAHLENMPKKDAYVCILPLKAVGLTEAPVRMIGLIKE